MNDAFEHELKQALRSVDAPPDFAAKVMNALPAHAAVSAAPSPRRHWWAAGLAASLAVVLLGAQHWQSLRAEEARRQQGMTARRELMRALRLTSDKLDIVYQTVNSPKPAASEDPS